MSDLEYENKFLSKHGLLPEQAVERLEEKDPYFLAGQLKGKNIILEQRIKQLEVENQRLKELLNIKDQRVLELEKGILEHQNSFDTGDETVEDQMLWELIGEKPNASN